MTGKIAHRMSKHLHMTKVGILKQPLGNTRWIVLTTSTLYAKIATSWANRSQKEIQKEKSLLLPNSRSFSRIHKYASVDIFTLELLNYTKN